MMPMVMTIIKCKVSCLHNMPGFLVSTWNSLFHLIMSTKLFKHFWMHERQANPNPGHLPTSRVLQHRVWTAYLFAVYHTSLDVSSDCSSPAICALVIRQYVYWSGRQPLWIVFPRSLSLSICYQPPGSANFIY